MATAVIKAMARKLMGSSERERDVLEMVKGSVRVFTESANGFHGCLYQVSLRNQLMVMFDWVKTNIFGRDLTRY